MSRADDQRSVRTGRWVDTAPGVRLHCAEAGEPGQPALVLLHGFPESSLAWHDLMPELARDWQVLAPDLRGYAPSSCPVEVGAYRIEHLVADVIALLDAIGIPRCVLVGHDWGGALAWAVAIAHPERIERLIILNAPHPVLFARALVNDAGQQRASAYMNWLRRAGSEQVLLRDDCALLGRMLTSTSVRPWFVGPVREQYVGRWCLPGTLAGMVNWYRATPLRPPLPGEGPAIVPQPDPARTTVRVPTLVLWGERDTALLPGLLDGLETLVPDLVTVRFAEASHWLVHEAPTAVLAAIRSFARAGDSVELITGTWDELGAHARPIRFRVFVDEQRVDPDLELDEADADCLHCVAWIRGVAVGTGRLLPDGHIGRMAVLPAARRSGLGGRILERLMFEARARGHRRVELSAQAYVESFYSDHGFAPEGPLFLEAGIEHVRMWREL